MDYPHVPAILGAEVAHILRKALNDHPPVPSTLQEFAVLGHEPRRLGGYLIGLGYLTPRQMVAMLAIQYKHKQQGIPVRLGELLTHYHLITPQVLVATLLVQSIDRLLAPQMPGPYFLGEHLLVYNQVTPSQLAGALQMQMHLHLQGLHVKLGNILIHQGILDQRKLTGILHHLHNSQHSGYLTMAPSV